MLPHVRNFALSFIISIVIFGIIGFIITPFLRDDLLGGFTAVETGDVTEQQTDDKSEQTQPQEQISPVGDIEGSSFTMLIIGSDYQPTVFDDYRVTVPSGASVAEYAANQRHYCADTILLLHADLEQSQYIISSIPGTTSVTAHGIDTTLGEVYETESLSYFRELAASLIGINIDYYVETRISLFKQVFDILAPSGVKFNVPYNMYYIDENERITEPGASHEIQYIYDSEGNIIQTILPGFPFTIDLKKGVNTLTGETASQLLRYKNHPDGNKKRAEIACELLKALADTALNEQGRDRIVAALVKIASSSEGSTDVDSYAIDDIIGILTAYPRFTVKTLTVPGSYIKDGGKECFHISKNEAQKMFAQYK